MTRSVNWLRDLSTESHQPGDPAAALERIAAALEVLAGTAEIHMPNWEDAAYIWQSRCQRLVPAQHFRALDLDLLLGIDPQADLLERNTRQFFQGFPANNALLWGARGTGKSSLIKAVFQKLRQEEAAPIHLIEIHKEDLDDLPVLIALLARAEDRQFILFLDDLSFETADDRYKNLKSALEGGIEGQPKNILIYVTSNRRHLLPRGFDENDRLHPAETAEETISLSDRFGLWLGFYQYDQDTYLRMVASYARKFNIPVKDTDLRKMALEWSMTRGARSGRVAWQFIQDLAGQKNKQTDL
jgi:predicted AAA+ superfamily ATPase